METRANFVLIGAFTLAGVVGAFLFLMWIVGYGASGSHRHFQIVFNGSVSGLSTGANVLFNGLKVGEVTNLGFVKGNPSQVVADIDVTNESAPINAETRARLETQGLTGSGTVALIGGERGAPELTGNPPVIPSLPTATLADLQTKAGYVLDLINKLIVDNAQPIHQTLENVQTFSMALSSNASGVDAALKSVSELGKTLEPLATRLQALSEDADRIVLAVDPQKVREIVDNVQTLSGKAGSVLDSANKLIAESSEDIRTTAANASAFSKTLNANSANLEAALKGFGELGKAVQPAAQRIQTLSEDADKLVRAVDADKVKSIVDNVETLSVSANSAFSRADRLIADNSDVIHSTFENVNAFAETLADNRLNVDAGLKGFGDLGKTIGPLGPQIQSLADQANKVVAAVDPDKVKSIVDNAQSLSATANSAFSRADKLIADNSDVIHSTFENVNAFAATLADNRANVDATLKNLADLGKRIDPLAARLQSLSDDADKLVKSIDTEKVSNVVGNAQTFSQALAASSGDYQAVMRDGAALVARLNDTSKELSAALTDADAVLKSLDSKKIGGIVDSVGDVATTIRDNRGNIDETLKNASQMMAKLNASADKVDGVLTGAQSFLGSPGTKSAVGQIGDAAQSVKRLAEDLDVRIKEISVGLNRFSNSGLREYEGLAIQGRRVLDDVDRVVRSLERNPTQLLWGNKSSLPEYRGQ